MPTTTLTRLAAMLLFNLAGHAFAEAPTGQPSLPIWPGKVPGEKGDVGDEHSLKSRGDGVTRYTNVTRPTLTLFQAPKEKRNGTAVLIFPGGGYNILAWNKEGTEVATWLNSLGVTAVVLKYRVPRRKDRPLHEAPLQDAQRAMSIVRSRAVEWEFDPKRLGVLGFSAGGHLAAMTASHFDHRAYESMDNIDRVSCRPDFAVLVYPAYLVEGGQLKAEVKVTQKTPPMFLAHAGDDRISAENSVRLYLALKTAGVPAELHVYENGGHGFGLRPSDRPVSKWPARCADWLKNRGLLQSSPQAKK